MVAENKRLREGICKLAEEAGKFVAALVHIVDVQAVYHCRGFLGWLRAARRTVEDFEEVVSLQAAET